MSREFVKLWGDRLTPKAIVDALERRISVIGSPSQLRDAIEQQMLINGYSAASAAELCDRNTKKVAAEIRRRLEERHDRGEIATLHLRGIDDEIVHGSSFIFSDDTAAIKIIKLNRACAQRIYEYIRKLTFSQFEVFGRSVLRELGCRTAKITPHAGDQGIDFYGDLSIGGIIGADPAILKLMHETIVVIVGQAKHYPNVPIGPSVVRELVGSLSLSKTYTYSRDSIDLLDGVELRPFSPLMALLFTTGDFTKGARTLAKRAGLIAFSGLQLSVFLADKGIGLESDGDDVVFKEDLFKLWLT